MSELHIPVLKKEVLEYLNPKPDENFIDCTFGQGGHSTAILEKTFPKGKILGIEIDKDIYLQARKRMTGISKRLILVNDSYINLADITKHYNFIPVNGILLDLGMLSRQIENSGKGFSFSKNEPLDMRFDAANNELTAGKILNKYSRQEIEKILREYGEEKFSKRISEQIVKEREVKPIKTTFQLVEIIGKAVPAKYRYSKIKHFATRTFQALRIAVNDELNNLKKVLPQAVKILSPKGRIAVISFHSLEDRIVKNFFKNLPSENFKILTKKPVTSSKEEIRQNPRARSAKLRAVIKI